MKRADPLILNEYLRNCGNITLKPHHLKNIVGGANAAYRNESAWFATNDGGNFERLEHDLRHAFSEGKRFFKQNGFLQAQS